MKATKRIATKTSSKTKANQIITQKGKTGIRLDGKKQAVPDLAAMKKKKKVIMSMD